MIFIITKQKFGNPFYIPTIADLDNINSLFEAVVDDIHNIKKLNMWNTSYPFCEFRKNINDKEMYVILKDRKLLGALL